MVLAISLTLFGCFLFVCVYYWGSLTPNEITETLVANDSVKVSNNAEPTKWERTTTVKDATFDSRFSEENAKVLKEETKLFRKEHPYVSKPNIWVTGKNVDKSLFPFEKKINTYKFGK